MTKKHLFQNGLALFVCLFLFAGALFAQTQTESVRYTANGTWTVPNDVIITSVTFEAWGGGGAGGGVDGLGLGDLSFKGSGGGSGAAYARTVITDGITAGQEYTITVGARGTASSELQGSIFTYHYVYTSTDGGFSSVTNPAGSMIVKAAGGISVTGRNNVTGAQAAPASASIGNDVIHVGGNGSNSINSNQTNWTVTSAGSGGGAGGTNTDGGNGFTRTSSSEVNAGGNGGGGDAGKGGTGTGTWQDTPGSYNGNNYGGGGSGAWCTGTAELISLLTNHADGGQGGAGLVIVTYTYLSETIEAEDVTETICSNSTEGQFTQYNIPLDLDVFGFQLAEAHLSYNPNNITVQTEEGYNLDYTIPTFTYDNSDGHWHIVGSLRNNSTETSTITIPATALTKSWGYWDEFTITINIYPRLNGGVIAKDQFVCADQTIEILRGDGTVVTGGWSWPSVTTAEASGGSGSGSYQWYRAAYSNNYVSGSYEAIPNANAKNYMPGNGHYAYKRQFVDQVCGSAWATDGHGYDYIATVTVNPLTITETDFSEDTICSNEDYYHQFSLAYTSPAEDWFDEILWQKSTDKGNTWVYAGSTVAGSVYVHYYPNELEPGTDVWFRYAFVFGDCDPVPGNSIQKIHVKEIPSYTGQFKPLTLTLWYGACDTSIANLAKPVLTPTPAEITGPACEDGLRLVPGTYTITWTVKPDEDCDIYATYEQQLTVEFPKCGTLDEPYIVKDRDGNEYNTIRIGCDCWFAENLRSNADNATYYDEDDANEAFGKLYDWNDAVGSFNEEMETKLGTTYIQGVCPMGWAVPTVAQYNTMMDVVGSIEDLKTDDQSAWLPGMAGTNASGFAAMGAGYFEGMQYQRLLGYTYFWTADLNESNNNVAKAMELRVGCDELTVVDKNKANKYSLRCVKVEPLNYININIAFDMNDDFGDGWNGSYILAEYGASSVKIIGLGSHNECTIPVPQGSDVTLTWFKGSWAYEVSFTVTNEATGEVLYQAEMYDMQNVSNNTVLTNFHVDGACNPADLQVVNFVLKQTYADSWDGGVLQVNYGTGVMNLTVPISSGYQEVYPVELPVGAHISLDYLSGAADSENYFSVEYPDGTVIFETPTVDSSIHYEFDVVKQ